MQLLLETAMSEARWRLGRVLLDPWFSLQDLSYIDNVGNRPEDAPIESDYTVTVGAGVRSYVPLGTDHTFSAHVLPEYVWFKELTSRRRLNGRFGLGFFGQEGPMGYEVTATRVDDARFLSRELEQLVNTSEQEFGVALEFDLPASMALTASGGLRQLSYDPEDAGAEINLLDRDETVARLGVASRRSEILTLGLGVEFADVQFEEADSRRSNDGVFPYLELTAKGTRTSLNLNVAFEDREFGDDPLAEDFSETTGNGNISWIVMNFLDLTLYGRRQLVYSFSNDYSYFLDDTLGLGVRTSLGSFGSLWVFGESGDASFTAFDRLSPTRVDDFETWGGELQMEVGASTLIFSSARTKYDSTLPAFDRTVTVTTLRVLLTGRSISPWG
jgi:hypothetical protein